MNAVQSVLLAIVAVGMVTTLVLPGRQTAKVIQAAGNVFSGGLKTAMGR